MLSPAEHVRQAGRGAGFAGAGCHDQQMLPKALVEFFADGADGLFLVIAVCDLVINGDGEQIAALCPPGHQLLQIVLAENPADAALGAGLIVPEPGFKAVGGKDHGAASELAFQAVGIQYGLLAPDAGVLAAALGLHHRKRQAVLAEQHIIRKTRLSDHASHILHRVLDLYIRVRAVKAPAHDPRRCSGGAFRIRRCPPPRSCAPPGAAPFPP